MHGIIVPDRVTRPRNMQDLTLGWIKFWKLYSQVTYKISLFLAKKSKLSYIIQGYDIRLEFG